MSDTVMDTLVSSREKKTCERHSRSGTLPSLSVHSHFDLLNSRQTLCGSFHYVVPFTPTTEIIMDIFIGVLSELSHNVQTDLG